jgi:hypothetical protein
MVLRILSTACIYTHPGFFVEKIFFPKIVYEVLENQKNMTLNCAPCGKEEEHRSHDLE